MRLLLVALLTGCSPPECEEDDRVRASFQLQPDLPPGDTGARIAATCTVSGVSDGSHALTCPSLIDSIGTDTLNLFVLTEPPLQSPLVAGDAVSFEYYDRSHIITEKYFSLRKGGVLALAGQRSFKLGPSPEERFYSPLSIDVAPLECGSEGRDCGTTTRIGLRFATTTVYDHQFRSTADGSFWLESAHNFDDNGSCSDTVGQFYEFIIAAP
jgi:hypothetical protein